MPGLVLLLLEPPTATAHHILVYKWIDKMKREQGKEQIIQNIESKWGENRDRNKETHLCSVSCCEVP